MVESKSTAQVRAALGGKGVTIAELAEATGLGQSTVGKALASLETAGEAARTPGGRDGGRRLADSWTTAGGAEVERLGMGQLRDLVLAHLRRHPQEFSPTALSHTLGRSAGAISNALVKLAATGAVVQTSERPRRYAIRR